MQRAFFTAANLIDGVNTPKPNSAVVVEDDRIIAVVSDGTAQNPPPAIRYSTSAVRA
jgi:hypothetical protein